MSRSKCDSCPRVKALEAKIERLERRVAELTAALEETRRAGKRPCAPFSKGEAKPKPRRPGRKPGKECGKRASRPRPRRVDEDCDVPASERRTRPGCGGRVREDGVADQYHTDIPPVRPITRRFRVHHGRCERCGRRDEMSGHGFAVARGRIEARADRLLESRLSHEPDVRLQKHLADERGALFTFPRHPEAEPTDWPGEQAIRPGVVNRKASGGSRSDRGGDAQGILTSVYRTARQQGRDPVALSVKLFRSPRPVDLGLARGRTGRPRLAPLPRGQPTKAAA
jgi:hypothetical protein